MRYREMYEGLEFDWIMILRCIALIKSKLSIDDKCFKLLFSLATFIEMCFYMILLIRVFV